MPGAGRKPNAIPTKPRLIRLTDEQHAMHLALGGSPWLQGLLNLEIRRQAECTKPFPRLAACGCYLLPREECKHSPS